MTKEQVRNQLNSFICTEILQKPSYSLADNVPLISGGVISSFSFVEILVFIEEKFNVYIPDREWATDSLDTMSQIVDRIMRELP